MPGSPRQQRHMPSRGRRQRPASPRRPAPARRPDPYAGLDQALDAAAALPQPEPTTFGALGLDDRLTGALAARGIETPFAIQARALPDAVAGRSILGRAQTGSGKTLAFGLPLLTRLAAEPADKQLKTPRALILVPTRELAGQVADVLGPLGRRVGLSTATVYGGVGIGPQIEPGPPRRPGGGHARPAHRPDGTRGGAPGRHRDHGARRGGPHGRPRLPARGDPDPGRHAARRPADALLRHPGPRGRAAGRGLRQRSGAARRRGPGRLRAGRASRAGAERAGQGGGGGGDRRPPGADAVLRADQARRRPAGQAAGPSRGQRRGHPRRPQPEPAPAGPGRVRGR